MGVFVGRWLAPWFVGALLFAGAAMAEVLPPAERIRVALESGDDERAAALLRQHRAGLDGRLFVALHPLFVRREPELAMRLMRHAGIRLGEPDIYLFSDAMKATCDVPFLMAAMKAGFPLLQYSVQYRWSIIRAALFSCQRFGDRALPFLEHLHAMGFRLERHEWFVLTDDERELLRRTELWESQYALLALPSGGIGLVWAGDLLADNPLRIGRLVPGFPAADAGLLPGDRITAVDGESTDGMSAEFATARIRGWVGTTVRLDVLRDGQAFRVRLSRRSFEGLDDAQK